MTVDQGPSPEFPPVSPESVDPAMRLMMDSLFEIAAVRERERNSTSRDDGTTPRRDPDSVAPEVQDVIAAFNTATAAEDSMMNPAHERMAIIPILSAEERRAEVLENQNGSPALARARQTGNLPDSSETRSSQNETAAQTSSQKPPTTRRKRQVNEVSGQEMSRRLAMADAAATPKPELGPKGDEARKQARRIARAAKLNNLIDEPFLQLPVNQQQAILRSRSERRERQ